MESQLGTANLFLGIMAVVSVVQALLVIGAAVGGFIVYRRVMALLSSVQEQQIAPAMVRVNAILDDVKSVSATVKAETERVDDAIHSTIDHVDHTMDRVRWNVRARTSRIVGIVRGARAAIESMLHTRAA
jgi:outer membrane lipoprotein-sorting protein